MCFIFAVNTISFMRVTNFPKSKSSHSVCSNGCHCTNVHTVGICEVYTYIHYLCAESAITSSMGLHTILLSLPQRPSTCSSSLLPSTPPPPPRPPPPSCRIPGCSLALLQSSWVSRSLYRVTQLHSAIRQRTASNQKSFKWYHCR